MNERVDFLKRHGKFSDKQTVAFYSKASMEDIKMAEKGQEALDFSYLDQLDKVSPLDPDNPQARYGATFDRWLIRKNGLVWYIKYLQSKLGLAGTFLSGKLRLIGVPEEDIAWVLEGKRTYVFNVVGVTYGNRQEALSRLVWMNPRDIHTFIVPEPDNSYDPDALAVMVLVQGAPRAYCIGYIARADQEKVKPFIGSVPGFEILSGDSYGVRLRFVLKEAEPLIN
jgi:hypothetical protein